MANGRMINHAITKDLRVNRLSDDTSRLAFTWLIPFADREGRTYGDPAIVRSMLFPRRDDVTIDMMAGYIQEWHEQGLVIWYSANGDKFIYFPAFDKNQPGLRKERESASILPPPSRDDCEPTQDDSQTIDGVHPEYIRSNDGIKEVKLKEVKERERNENAQASADHPSNWIIENLPKPEQDPFDTMQRMVETLTGYPIPTNVQEIKAINEFIALGVIEADIRDALAFLSGAGKVARGASGLAGSVKVACVKRTQKSNGRKAAPAFVPEDHASEVY